MTLSLTNPLGDNMKFLGTLLFISLTIFSAQAKNFNGKTVRIVNLHSGLCLDAANVGYYKNRNIQQFKCHGGANQRIKIQQVNEAYAKIPLYQLVDELTGQCYDVTRNSSADHANIQLFPCHGGANQTFQLPRHLARTPGIKEEFYRIKPTNSGKCLDIAYQSTKSQANVEQFCCKRNFGQIFLIQEVY